MAPAPPTETPRAETEYAAPLPKPPSPSHPEPERSRPSEPIRKAIDEVNQIIESLKTVLGEIEEVIELLEMAEVQKQVDESEIATLRQALKRLQRGRESRYGADDKQMPRSAQEAGQ